MRNRWFRIIAASLTAALLLAACGSGDEPVATPDPEPAGEAPSEGEPGEEEEWRAEPAPEDDSLRDLYYMDPSIRDLHFVSVRDRYTIIANIIPSIERNWNRQFDSVTVQYALMDPIPALLSDAWIVQGEPALLWPALQEEVIDAVLVAVYQDTEAWTLLTGPGFDTPESLEGARFGSGGPGWAWDIVARVLFEQEWGINIDDHVEWVTVSGGSDGMMEALLAGQIDGFMGQPRHIDPTLESGGNLLYRDLVDNAQEMWMVERSTMENNRDAVCAMIEGALETMQWIEAGSEDNKVDRLQYIDPMLQAHGYDTTDSETTWTASWPFTWSRDMGASAAALDTQVEILSQDEEAALRPDFDWREHFDFSCVWDLQEKYGMPLNPDPADV